MRAILIDPADRTVCELSLLTYHDGRPEPANPRHQFLETLYSVLDLQGSPFGVRSLGDNQALYFDDEALLKLEEGEVYPFFEIRSGRGNPLSGKALVLGTTWDGDSASTNVPIWAAIADVRFTRRRYLGILPLPETRVRHPIFGEVVQVGSTAQFSDPLE